MKRIIALLIGTFVFGCCLGGCKTEAENNMEILGDGPADGGTVNNTDNDAPKEIMSEGIVNFACDFFLYGEYGCGTDSAYGISVQKDEDGRLILSEDRHKISCETDEAFLSRVQEIIKQNNLISLNGIDSYTNGLPEEFQPCYFRAEYESGEKLYFCTDNDPQSNWGQEMFALARDEFDKNGITELDPPDETEN